MYKVKCRDCEAVYIGQTGRKINKRIKEHCHSILNNVKNTAISTHCMENNHFLDTDNVKLLHTENKGKQLNFLEQLEIKKSITRNPFTTNDQQNFQRTPIIHSLLRIT